MYTQELWQTVGEVNKGGKKERERAGERESREREQERERERERERKVTLLRIQICDTTVENNKILF